ncbi:MAG: AEC family transporter [Clostridia bacterium]|nr:AEC family transporter [Clostridia bacterium]
MFEKTLWQMLTMFAFILVGYALRRTKILPEQSGVTMARLETYFFVPALSLSNMMAYCTVERFRENWTLILYGAVLVIVFILVAIPLSHLFVPGAKTSAEEYQRSIYRYGMSFANYGFMGDFIILEVFGNLFFFKYKMFCLVVGIFCSSYGLYLLIPKDKGAGLWHNVKKGLLAPPMLALFAGIAVGLLNLGQYLPPFLTSMLEKAGACQGPVAMVLAGFVIAGFPLREILVNKKVYVATFVRMVAIPAVIVLALHLLKAPTDVRILALICFGTPLGLNSIVYPQTYGGDVKTGAAMASISHTLSVVIIPLMYLLLIELLA